MVSVYLLLLTTFFFYMLSTRVNTTVRSYNFIYIQQVFRCVTGVTNSILKERHLSYSPCLMHKDIVVTHNLLMCGTRCVFSRIKPMM